jgi:NAD(P)-dependent dehydrogenase (short-subunit alcohol dehydrogenase family)
MKNKIVFITGSTDGIGKQTACELAQLGANVLLHARNHQRGETALRSVKAAVPDGNFDLFVSDLADFSQVKKMASEIIHKYPVLDVLINNAAVILDKRQVSIDGVEMTFQINHLAHFLLTNLLLENIRKAEQGRIVNVSSTVHQSARFELKNLQGEKNYSGYNAYCCSKLENLLFTVRLASMLDGENTTVNALHPGVIGTKLLKAAMGGSGGFGSSLKDGAATSVFLASSPDVKNVSGKYFVNSGQSSPGKNVFDVHLQDEVWKESERLTQKFL